MAGQKNRILEAFGWKNKGQGCRPGQNAIYSELILAGSVRVLRRCGVNGKAREPGKEGGQFKGHFIARRSIRNRRSLDHVHTVEPWVKFNSAAQRKGRDLIQFVLVERRSRRN